MYTDRFIERELKLNDMILILSLENKPEYSGRVGVVNSIDGTTIIGTWGDIPLIEGRDTYRIFRT